MIEKGATIWARQTIESEIFYSKPDKWFKIWFYIIYRVNHKEKKQFKRGTCFTTYKEISQYTKANKNEIDHCIRWLKSATMITTQKATRGFILNVVNYDKYQDLDNYKSDTESDNKSDLKATQKRHYKQECKNEKNNTKVLDKVKTSNPLIDYIIIKTKELAHTPTLDGKNNRNMAFNLIRYKIKPVLKDEGILEPTDEQIRQSIDTIYENASKDVYWSKQIKSVNSIYYNFNKFTNK